MSFAKKLEKSESISDVFEIVKETVKKSIDRERAGLMLGLAELGVRRGWFIGAFHPVGSNIIVVNKTVLRMVEVTKPKYYNAYCFHVLLHEYLHTIGVLDEDYTRKLAYLISKNTFGELHPVTLIAQDFNRFFPEIAYAGLDMNMPERMPIEIVEGFDESSVSYIG